MKNAKICSKVQFFLRCGNAWKLILITNGLMHKLGAVLPSRHLLLVLLLLVDPHRHAASRAKQKHLNTNNNNNHPKQSFSLGFSTLREKFFFKLRSRFLISQEKLFCVCWNIHKPLGPNRIFKTEERAKATKNKDCQFFFFSVLALFVSKSSKNGRKHPLTK